MVLSTPQRKSAGVYIGIDPGSNGGIAWVASSKGKDPSKVWCGKIPDTERDRWDMLLGVLGSERSEVQRRCVIEQQTPRPTRYVDRASGRQISTVLASTVTLYGSYMQLRAFLTAAEVSYEDVPSRRWQYGMKIVRQKGESDTVWKNRLKTKAQQLFPDTKVTLYTADALLMAEYCRRIHEGTLER